MDTLRSGEASAVTASTPKSLLSSASWSLLSTVWFTAVGFLLTPFLTASLGADYYGLFLLVTSISGLLTVMDLGLGQATLRYVAYYYGRNDLAGINRAMGSTSAVYLVTGSLAWAMLFFGAPWLASWLALAPADVALGISLLRLTAFNLGLMLVSGAFGAIPPALQRYDINSLVTVAQSALQVVGTVVILRSGGGVYELVLWAVISTLVRQIANVVIAKCLIPRLRLMPLPSRAGLREVFGYGVFATATQMLGIVWKEADRLLVGGLLNTASVAYLSVPKSLVFRGTDAVASLGAALFPRFSVTQDLEEARRLFLTATWSLLLATSALYVPVTLLFPAFLRLWMGPEFAQESARIGQIIAFSCIIRGAYVPYQNLFQGIGKPQYLTAFYLASGLSSLAFNVALIPSWGLAGAGYAYVFTLIWGVVALAFSWRRVLQGQSLRPLLRAVAVPSALALSSLMLCNRLYTIPADLGWLGLLAAGGAMMVATTGLMIGVDLIWGAGSSYAGVLLRAVSGSVVAAPMIRVLMSRWENRS